jgi:hypothetical protein
MGAEAEFPPGVEIVEASTGVGWWAYDRTMLTVVEAEPNWVAGIALSRIGR